VVFVSKQFALVDLTTVEGILNCALIVITITPKIPLFFVVAATAVVVAPAHPYVY
jgi:hypothetical protein